MIRHVISCVTIASSGMHRLCGLCPSVSGVREFLRWTTFREVEAVYGTQRELREVRKVHA